ncbi:hypothetical protein [Streptomyces sp. PA5.6]|uniref:hypothetical protein n=1 Tax=Streptomyces sp. PA5.6 TaxID=3035651 RepID=UPI003904863E
MPLVSLTAVLGIAVTACSDDSSPDDGPAKAPTKTAKASPAPTRSADDPQMREKKAALSTYARMWDEQVKAYAQADIKGTDLKKYATKDALGRAMGDLLLMKRAGTAAKGAPTHHNTKVDAPIDLNAKIPKARVTDCLDITNWPTIKRSTGKVLPFPSAQPLRYLTTAQAEKWGKQWIITKVETHGNRTC